MRHLRPIATVLAALVLATGLLGACGEDDVTRDRFAEELHKATEGPDQISEADSRCIADAAFESFSQDEVDDLYKEQREGEIPEEVLTEWKRIVGECTGDR